MSTKWVLAMIITVTTAFGALPVYAQDSATEVHINLAHVDFADPAEVSKAYHDLKAQARDVCDTVASYDEVYSTAAERHCEVNAVSDAVRQVNRIELSQLDDLANRRKVHALSSLNAPGR